MNRQPFQIPPRWWSPKLNPLWIHFWRPFRRRAQFREARVSRIDVHGLEHLHQPLSEGRGIMITPNHPGHADAYSLYEASDKVRRPFYFMTAWQVFAMANAVERLAYRHHGCFSIDREGRDLRAFRQAVDILQEGRNPLVVFPEGDVYHINERVTPFRDGAAAMALSAAKRAGPIACVPCGIKYHYIGDPTTELTALMDQLEEHVRWRPRPDLPLPQRIYRYAEAALALKELEYLGRPQSGPLPQRLRQLADTILSRIEQRRGMRNIAATVPERVKELRQLAIKEMNAADENDPRHRQSVEDLDDLFVVIQLFSYPGDYVAERPTIERMAETLDKFEEDILRLPSARGRGVRRVIVEFGPAVMVEAGADRRNAGVELTRRLEREVQTILDRLADSTNLPDGERPLSPARRA